MSALDIQWYWSRLASMGMAEMAWRARSAVKLPFDWARCKGKVAVPKPFWMPLYETRYPVHLHNSAEPMQVIRVFDLQFPLGFEFDWHRDYSSGRQVPVSFAGALNIRDTELVGDIKYVWEPSRFQHLSALAYAANAEENASYIKASVDSWLQANPYLTGVHWTSSLELAERVISWSLLYPRIASEVAADVEFRERWLISIYLHLARIDVRLSLYSSANNHLIGELVGLYVAASCFDFWPDCKAWRARARQLLEREIRVQVGEDGVNREQAMSYHLFTLELFLLAYCIGRKTGDAFSEEYAQRLRKMTAFVDALATPGGDLPWYGDLDDARGFLFSESESALEVTLQLAGLLFGESAWLRFTKTPTTAAKALVPDLIEPSSMSKGRSEPSTTPGLFPDAGLACVRTHDGNIRLLMDFGPLGFTSTAAHGHADALSVWLAIGDEYFLVDAGTYAYHSQPDWRTFFRGTAAHNTARVDGLDQSVIAGRFLWSLKAASRLVQFKERSDRVTIEAEHDGYQRLPNPVTHRRTVDLCRATGGIDIVDSFLGTGRHEVELFFHLHQDAEVIAPAEYEIQALWRGRRIVFRSPDRHARWEIFRGAVDPKLGWRSQKFSQKQPIPTLRVRAEIEGSQTIRTQLRIYS